MGLEAGEAGLSATDVAKILDGHVKDLAEVCNTLHNKHVRISLQAIKDETFYLGFMVSSKHQRSTSLVGIMEA